MRKEDKVRLPPRLKVKLPKGFHIERKPDEYLLYVSYPVNDSPINRGACEEICKLVLTSPSQGRKANGLRYLSHDTPGCVPVPGNCRPALNRLRV